MKAGSFCPLPNSKVVNEIVDFYNIPREGAVNIFSKVGTANNKLAKAESLKDIQDSKEFKEALADAYLIGKQVPYTEKQYEFIREIQSNGALTGDYEVIGPLASNVELIKNIFGAQNVVTWISDDGIPHIKIAGLLEQRIFKHSLFRGQSNLPKIDDQGNLILQATYDNLWKGYGLSFANEYQSAESYGRRVSRDPIMIELDQDYLDTIMPLDTNAGTQGVNVRSIGDEYGGGAVEERLLFTGTIVIPKGKFKLYIPEPKFSDSTFDLANQYIRDFDDYNVSDELPFSSTYNKVSLREVEAERKELLKRFNGNEFNLEAFLVTITQNFSYTTYHSANYNNIIEEAIKKGILEVDFLPPDDTPYYRYVGPYIKTLSDVDIIKEPIVKNEKSSSSDKVLRTVDDLDNMSAEDRERILGSSEKKAYKTAIERAERMEKSSKYLINIEHANKKQIDFYNKFKDDPAAMHFLAETAVKYFSYIVTRLQTDPSANEEFFDDLFVSKDFTTMSREDILSDRSVTSAILNIARSLLDPEFAGDIDAKRATQLKEAYDDFYTLMSLKSDMLLRQEHIRLNEDGTIDTYVKQAEETANEEEENNEDSTDDEIKQILSPRDTLSMSNNDYSVSTKISQNIKVLLSTIQNVDKEGNIIYDTFGFNLPTFIDANTAEQSLLNWLQGCETKSEMFERLNQIASSQPWINMLLSQLNTDNPTPMQERLSSQFYVDMYKIATHFSQTFVRKSADNTDIFVRRDLGNKKAADALKQLLYKASKGQLSYQRNGEVQVGRGSLVAEIMANTYNKSLDFRKEGFDAMPNGVYGRLRAVYEDPNTYNDALDAELHLRKESPLYDIYKYITALGIDIEESTLPIMLSSDVYAEEFTDTVAHRLLTSLYTLAKTISDRQIAIQQGRYNPENRTMFDFDDSYTVYYRYRDLINELMDYETADIEPMVYDNNKAHYVYANPSFIQTLVYKLKNKSNNEQKFSKWFKDRYDRFKWFSSGYDEGGELRDYNLDMLRRLRYEPKARAVLEHSQKLSYDGVKYSQQSDLNYTLNIISDFFYDKKKETAWYRTPIASDKPSHDSIRWFRDSSKGYETRIAKQAFKIMQQEITRAKSVVEESLIGDKSTMFKYYDIAFKDKDKAARHAAVLQKKKNGEKITKADITDANGNYLYIGTGASFHYLPELNNLIISGSPLGNNIIDAIFNRGSQINEEIGPFVRYFIDYMDNTFIQEELASLESLGAFAIETKTIYNEETGIEEEVTLFKHFQSIINQYKPEGITYKYLSLESQLDIIQEAMRDFFYNTRIVKIQLAQLIGGDLAFYGDTTNFQKRFAQSHSSGLMFDKEATIHGDKVFDDEGKLRSLTIKSYKFKSTFKANIEQALKNRAALFDVNNPIEREQKKALEDLIPTIIAKYDEVDATDGQAYSSLTSYRKKQIGKGEWTYSDHDDLNTTMTDEAVYQRFLKGKPTVADFYHVFGQIRKPFVYKTVAKKRNSSITPLISVPMQDKNSEYMLCYLGAFVANYNPDSTLAAIFKWMEDSAIKNPRKGIDTINFDSAVKEGNHLEVIDISDPNLTPSEVISRLNKAYNRDGSYNETYVDEYDVSEYKEQQVNPEHFKDHAQQMGSQITPLAVAIIDDNMKVKQGNKTLTGKTIKERYFRALTHMTRLNANKLAEELKLGEGYNAKEHQVAVSKFIKRMFNANQKYNVEDKIAISIVDGRPVVTWEDEMLAEDIQAVLASAIKKAIYHRDMNGGPVVQTTGWGIDRSLAMRFYDKSGGFLLTLTEFAKKIGKTVEEAVPEYKTYISENQGTFAYYEAKVPMTEDIKEFAIKYGIKDEKELIKALPKEMLDMIAYRIPTEWAYSIFPIKAVGFTNENSGDSVMLPLEGTLISGFDFDTDKLFIMTKYYKFDSENNKFTEITLNNYDKENSREEYKAWANEALDMMRAALLSTDTTAEMFQPGNFEDLEQLSYVYSILKNTDYTIPQVQQMSESQRKDLALSFEQGDIGRLSWDVKMHRLNMVSKDLIAQAAVSSVSHVFLSLASENRPIYQKIPQSRGFIFDNISVMDRIQVDAKYGFDNSLISTYLCKYIGASADGAKNPVLGRIGVTQLSMNIISTLLRWGFNNEQATLFVTQPIIQRLIVAYENEVLTNPGINPKDVARDLEINIAGKDLGTYRNKNKNITSNDLYERLTISQDTIDKWRIEAQSDPQENNDSLKKLNAVIQSDVALLEIFSTIYTASQQLMNLGNFVRHNSVSQGPRSTIGGIRAQRDKREEAAVSIKKSFEGVSVESLERLLPHISEMISDTDKLVDSIIMRLFPSYESNLYTYTENRIKAVMRTRYLDDEMENQLHKAMKLYCFSKPWSTKESSNARYTDVRDSIINLQDSPTLNHYAINFVDWYEKQLETIKQKSPEDYMRYIESNELLHEFIIEPPTDKFPVKAINTNISGYSKDKIAVLQNAWSSLIASDNQDIKDLGIELFKYFSLRSHLGYSPKTPFHIAPTSVKVATPGYNTAQDSANFYTASYEKEEELALQFILNNSDNALLVPSVDAADLKQFMVLDEATDTVRFKITKELDRFSSIMDGERGVLIVNSIFRDSNTGKLVYLRKQGETRPEVITYLKTDENNYSEPFTVEWIFPWGAQHDFAEYIPGKDIASKSVFTDLKEGVKTIEDFADASYSIRRQAAEDYIRSLDVEGLDMKKVKNAFKQNGIEYSENFENSAFIKNVSTVKQELLSGSKLDSSVLLDKLGYKGKNNETAAALVSRVVESVLKDKNVC